MTPKMIQLFSHALQVCLDEGYYCSGKNHSNKFMCNALNAAELGGRLSPEDSQESIYFLSRWVRWMSHLIQYKTMCVVCVQVRVKQLDMDEHTWLMEGHGIVFYRELIQRLQQKAAQRAVHQ